MDRFDAMQAFARVVETGSFTKAAETLHMSRTSVTQLVQQLEARLRVKLLNRTTRKVNVTADGAVYYERVQKLLADMEDAETSLSSASMSARGRLRVDVPSPFATLILVPALPDFHARYPDIELHLGVSDRVVDLIDENVDCVVRGGEVTNPSLVARHVGDLRMGVYAAPAYLAMAGVPTHPHALEGSHHRIVSFGGGRTQRVLPRTLHRDGEILTIQGRYALAVDDGNAYLAAGLAGMGVLWMPAYMAKGHIEDGALVQLFQDWSLQPMPMYLAFRPNRHVSAKLRVFMDWVAELMARHMQSSIQCITRRLK
ncbi:LysR family transcriptional regulator [Pusillimonas sp. TS35]|uniref:LysR substrate-binding domain-containing protein n=1 Tax=Paracandidimonas lactea TaxID=2895524 RepID=UPI00136CEBC6|nr:LysR family transcriptional regulator [Paracandidimonas lactea]MYN14228.1 LysR family transcriptional regulator [Pusillimonas sp. TS35]